MNMDFNNNAGTQEELLKDVIVSSSETMMLTDGETHEELFDEKSASTANGDDPGILVVEDGQLSLFGFDSVIAPSSSGKKDSGEIDSCKSEAKLTSGGKADAKSGKGKSKVAAPVVPLEPKLESVNLGESWKIHYAAQVFEVDVLFVDEIAASKVSVSFEEIRLKLVMEEDAAELTPSGTKWRYDADQKQLYPEAWGQEKGIR